MSKPYTLLRPDSENISFTHRWNNNYYHWSYDILADYLLAKKQNLLSNYRKMIWSPQARAIPFCKEMLLLAEVDHSKIFWSHHQEHPEGLASYAEFEWSQRYQGCPPKWITLLLREYILTPALKDTVPNKTIPILVIDRKNTHRCYDRSEQFVALLKKHEPNVQKFYPEEHSVAKQLQTIVRSNIIIGLHGAGLTNLYAIRPGSIFIELQPKGYQQGMYKHIVEHCEAQYRNIVELEDTEPNVAVPMKNFYYDPQELLDRIIPLCVH